MTTELIQDIKQQYDFSVSETYPLRDGMVLTGGNNKIVIKKTYLSPDRIIFNHMVKEHLAASGFPCTDRYLVNRDGFPYVNIEGNYYTVTNKIEGRECNFDNPIDLCKSAYALAAMHLASIGASYPEEFTFAKRDLGFMPVIFRHRINELKRFKKVARKGKSKFDYVFLKEVDYFIEEGEITLINLNDSAYMSLVTKAAMDNSICHHDFTQHNIILSNNKEYITGFDNCCVEIKEYDIANFLRRKMRKCEWDIPTAKCMLDNYRSVCKIRDNEFRVLQIIINFPQKFWRIANKFYNSKRSWCEKGCLEKMEEVLREAAPLKNFINNFDFLI